MGRVPTPLSEAGKTRMGPGTKWKSCSAGQVVGAGPVPPSVGVLQRLMARRSLEPALPMKRKSRSAAEAMARPVGERKSPPLESGGVVLHEAPEITAMAAAATAEQASARAGLSRARITGT